MNPVGALALEEILISRGLVTRADLDGLSRDATGRRSLADRLVGAGLLSEEQIGFAVSEELGYPLVAVSRAGADPAL